jgi:pseudaminic acid cytidylyltransferase
MRLAVIPARGGSKRILRKNIRSFCGKPMIAWSIETARQSGCFDRIIVSTDDEEIADIARTYGAEAPFLRPERLADDHTGTIPVIAHAIEWLTEQNFAPEHVCCIYATAPFMTAPDLRESLAMLVREDCSYVFPVTSFGFPIQRAIRLTSDGRTAMFYPEQFKTRSQDLEEAYHDAGQFYWGRAAAWASAEPIFSSRGAPLILPRYRVQDIDTPEDWARAELMFEALRRKQWP